MKFAKLEPTPEKLGLHYFHLAKQHLQMAQYHHLKTEQLKKSNPRSKVGIAKKGALAGYHHSEKEFHLKVATHSLGHAAKQLPTKTNTPAYKALLKLHSTLKQH